MQRFKPNFATGKGTGLANLANFRVKISQSPLGFRFLGKDYRDQRTVLAIARLLPEKPSPFLRFEMNFTANWPSRVLDRARERQSRGITFRDQPRATSIRQGGFIPS